MEQHSMSGNRAKLMTASAVRTPRVGAELVRLLEPVLELVVHVARTVHVDHGTVLSRRDVVDLGDSWRVESMLEKHADSQSLGLDDDVGERSASRSRDHRCEWLDLDIWWQ